VRHDVFRAVVHDDAPAGGDDVAIPVHPLAVGEFGDESLGNGARISGVS
jgi:hypothetical protein